MGYFLPYQERWVTDNSTLKIYEKSRRVGITYATSFRCVLKCLNEKKDSSFTQWVSSRDEMTAKEFITDYVAMWAKEANKIAKELAQGLDGAVGLDGKNVEVVDEKHGITAFVVRFKNGARICSLSSNPLAFAGKGGDILLDEMDLHENQETLYAMAYPCITWGGQLEIVSAYSADGSENTEFAKLCKSCKEGNPKGFSFHRTDLDNAIAEGFVEKVNEVKRKKGRPTQTREEFRESIRKGCISLAAWLSQYMCEPNKANGEQAIGAADLAASIRAFEILRLELKGDAGINDIIDPCCATYVDTAFWSGIFDQCGRLALGYDIARNGDLSSVWINRDDDGFYTLKALITMKNCKFETQKQIVAAMFEAGMTLVGCGDKTGLGMSTCESLETAYSERFRGVNFSASKLTLGTTMQSIFEQRRQLIPLDHPEISSDIAGIKKTSTIGGKLSFTETKNELLPDSHCDLGWSCALAHYAAATIENFGPCFFAPAVAPDPVFVPYAIRDEWGDIGQRSYRF